MTEVNRALSTIQRGADALGAATQAACAELEAEPCAEALEKLDQAKALVDGAAAAAHDVAPSK